MRGDRMAKRSSFGNTIRKRLSDITNYQPQSKSPPGFDQVLAHNASSSSTKEYIDHLLKENAGLMKLVTEKNKLIEFNGVELQKLRVIVQKTQLQNWNLAQSNSHMLAELNLGKQKLKSLQHELICKDALLKAKNLELEEAKRQMNGQNNASQIKDRDDDDDVDAKQQNDSNRRRCPTRSQSTGPSTTFQQVSEKETVENKRRCMRRQSARFRSQDHENLFEIEDVKMHQDEKCESSHRMSLGRPSRRAAEKVQSYKETPLNIKMRRPE